MMIRLFLFLGLMGIFSSHIFAIEIGEVHCSPVATTQEGDDPLQGDGELIFSVKQLEGENVFVNGLEEKSFGSDSFSEGMLGGDIKISVSGWSQMKNKPYGYLKLRMEHTKGVDQNKEMLVHSWQLFNYETPIIFMVKTQGDAIKEVGVYCEFLSFTR